MPTYCTLLFALLLALTLVVAVLGTGAEPTTAADIGPLVYLASLAGPLCIALAGILVIALAFGRAGLRDLLARSVRWRVGVHWYAVALLTAPLVWTAILSAFWLTSASFLPDIITAEDKASLLVAGLAAGLVAGFFEELGWTGFATHELGKRHGLLATGLIVGLPWCLVHLPLYAGTSSGGVPKALYAAVALSPLLPYRVLMVWVYGHTRSVLMGMLMHLPISACAFLLGSAAMVGVPELVFGLVFSATLWALVAAAAAADRRSRGGIPASVPMMATGSYAKSCRAPAVNAGWTYRRRNPMQTQTLTLAEELLLLTLDDANGTVPMAAAQPLAYGLAGATLMDLALRGRLTSDGEHLVVADATPTGDALLDQALATIAAARRARESAHWVRTLGTGIKRHRQRLEERLVERGILHHQDHRILGVIPSPRYPTDDPRPEMESRLRIRAAVLGDSPPDARTVTLISLAQACRVLDGLFTREEREAMQGRVAAIIRGEALGEAVKETVEAINAAVIAATVTAAVLARPGASAS